MMNMNCILSSRLHLTISHGLAPVCAALCLGLLLPGLVSCNGYDGRLKGLDEAIAGQNKYRDSIENRIVTLGHVFNSAPTDSLKWEAARRVYQSSIHWSRDTVFRYQHLMENLASDSRQTLFSRMAKVRILLDKNENALAEGLFLDTDTSAIGCERTFLLEWLRCRMVLYTELASDSASEAKGREYREIVSQTRRRYLGIDSTSFYARRVNAQMLRDEGETAAALEAFGRLYEEEDIHHSKASAAYSISRIYEAAGEDELRFDWLVRSAEQDFKAAERGYMSLYELALMLYDRRQYRRAERYISQNLMDVTAGNFSKRLLNSGKAKLIITEASRRVERSRFVWLTIGAGFVSLLLVVIFILFQRGIRLQHGLEETNRKLTDANKIKNGYVFRYMDLALHYIDRIGETRNELRALGKSEGYEAVMKALRSPSVMYREYEDYYRAFDETFLGLYPDFVEKVNELLSEECRFTVSENGALPTELRMLAAIRIGITGSGQIAKFLKCSPNTVYTYRAKLKRAALCPKDEFEARIFEI